VINLAHNASQKGEELDKDSLAASFQKTASEMLVSRTIAAAEKLGYKTVAVAGGVSANSGVRTLFEAECAKRGFDLYMPPLNLCGDNGAMISCQGYFDYMAGKRADVSLNAIATLSLEDI
jgi:N6-L-threonylcarbamoyladenine synthase